MPDLVLRAGAAEDAEHDAIKQHPVLGAILRWSLSGAAHPDRRVHPRRPDGRQFLRLRGDDIPLAARIVHAADAGDAITSACAYRGARRGDA